MVEVRSGMHEVYSLQAVVAECETLGMPVDYEGAVLASVEAKRHGLTQAQFDAALVMHARRVKFLFSPRSYDWKTRLALAWHFLANPKGW